MVTRFRCPVPGCAWSFSVSCTKNVDSIEALMQAHFDEHGFDAEFMAVVFELLNGNIEA